MTPILTPLIKLLQSRKFLLALAVTLVGWLVQLIPELAPHKDALTLIISCAFGVVFLHLSAEDLIKLFQGAPDSSQAAKDLASEISDEILALLTEVMTPPAEKSARAENQPEAQG